MMERATFWVLFRISFSGLIGFFLFVRWFLPEFPVDLPAAALIALLAITWVMPYLKRFTLPGGVGGEFADTLPAPKVVSPAAVPPHFFGVPPAGPEGVAEFRRALRARMLAPLPPYVRSLYSTMIETAFFVKLETELTEPGDEVQRYPRILVNGSPSWCSFHALVRPRGWRGRRFYYVADAIGGIVDGAIEAILRDIRSRAEFTNEVLASAPNEFVLIVVSDFEDRQAGDRQFFDGHISAAQSIAKVPALTWRFIDLQDLPF